MKPWRENISFSKPLRDIKVVAIGPILQELDRLFKEREQTGFERGRNEGEKALSEMLVQQRSELQELLNGVIGSMNQAIPQLIHESEPLLIALAAEIAIKLVGEQIISSQMIESVVKQALKQVKESSELDIYLNKHDLDLLNKNGSSLLSSNEEGIQKRFLASPEVTQGGCIIQTRFGQIDARRETKIRILKEALKT
jgi:flagellar assembly protein FliH